MGKDEVKKIMTIVTDNVEEVLDKYLAYELLRKIKTEISAGVEWDLYNQLKGED